MKRSALWLLFTGISLLVMGLLYLTGWLLQPLGLERQTREARTTFEALEIKNNEIVKALWTPGKAVSVLMETKGGHRLLALEVPEYHGVRDWIVVFDPDGAVLGFSPRPAMTQSALYHGLSLLEAPKAGLYSREDLDAVTGASLDRSLLLDTVRRAWDELDKGNDQ